MLLHREPGQSRIEPAEIERRADAFRRGEWPSLLRAACPSTPARPAQRSPAEDDSDRRAARAAALVHLGELSAASRALTAEPLADGNEATLAELRDPSRRPQTPVVPLSPAVLNQVAEPCPMPDTLLLANLRSARRGSAAGPSGMTNEHLRLMLDDPGDFSLLHQAALRFANADVPAPILAAARLGRIVALRKPNGRVRALVVGDVFRRLVARTLAQHFAEELQAACMPYQFGLSTRAGTEALYKLLQVATECNPRATVLSVDAVGAFDHVSRQAMLEGLRSRPQLAPLLPFARQFYGSESSYVWTDDAGAEHEVLQAEGGEQGDPLMPALYAVAQHPALEAVAAALQPGEGVFAFLDDIYIVCSPERVATLYGVLAAALWDHARVQLNQGKTRVWNAAGEEPPNLAALQPDPSSATGVWVGAWTLPPEQQGLVVLGAPLGTEAFVQRHLRDRRRNQDALLERIPTLGDLQSAWLLLLFCASTRANYLLRMLPPHCTADYSREHDRAIASCLRTLLYGEEAPELPAAALATARLPLGLGGLGLRSATSGAPAAYWASWQDVFPALLQRFPADAARLQQACLREPHAGMPPALAAACTAATRVRDAGFPAPDWSAEAAPAAPHPPHGTATCAAGSELPSLLVTSARSRRTFLTSPLRPERCCSRKLDPIPVVPSQCSLRLPLSPCPPTTSGCSFCDGCVCRSPWRRAPVVAEAASTRWETTAQPVRRPVCWRPEPSHLSTRSPASAGRAARELHATSGSLT